MNANNLENFKVSSSCGATASSASSSLHQNANIREIPEEIQPIQAEFPPTIKLLVYLWDEIKSYCIQVPFINHVDSFKDFEMWSKIDKKWPEISLKLVKSNQIW